MQEVKKFAVVIMYCIQDSFFVLLFLKILIHNDICINSKSRYIRAIMFICLWRRKDKFTAGLKEIYLNVPYDSTRITIIPAAFNLLIDRLVVRK